MSEPLVVVVGAAGKLGRLVVRSVLEHPGARVRALVRDPSKPSLAQLASDRVEVIAFDAAVANNAERADAVRGAYAVVSTLQGGPDIIIDAQLALIRAASAVGVRRFIPSDYSYNITTLPEGVNINSDWRRTLAHKARAEVTSSFEVVHVFQGVFIDKDVLGFLGMFDGDNRVVRYWGDGTVPIDWTTWEDTAKFITAAALDPRPVPEHLFVRGDRQDVFGFARAWEAAHAATLTLERLGSLEDLVAETRRRLQAEPQNMFAWLPLMYAQGTFGGKALLGDLHNGRYPAIRPATLVEAMAAGAV